VAITSKGARTRTRILQTAAELIQRDGVAGTSLDDVCLAANASKSQLYHYFADKGDLVRQVIATESERVFDEQRPTLDRLDSWAALQRWCDQIVARKAKQGCRGGCPVGSLVGQLAEVDPLARTELATAFERWESYLTAGLTAMRDRGELRSDASPTDLAVATMASLEGGLLLSQATRSTRPLRIALDAALRHLRGWAAA
jgi:AcrR family transcriptional regulator